MHELSVATDIAELAFGAAGGRVVERLTVRNGAFSSVSTDSLRFYLEILLEERQGRKADIVIEEAPARCRCECGASYETARFLDPCPACGGWKRQVESGLECRLESIEVPDAAEGPSGPPAIKDGRSEEDPGGKP